MIYTNKFENNKLGDVTFSKEMADFQGWTLVFEDDQAERSDVDGCWYEKGYAPMKSDMDKADDLKREKLAEAERLLQAKLQALSDYPQAESASFETQEREAAAYLADPEIAKTEIPTITGIALGSQVELAELANKIVANANSFAPLRGLYLGRHKRVRDLLAAATTLAEVEAVDVQGIFDEDLGSANTMQE